VGETLEVNNYMYRGQLVKKLILKKTGEDQFSVTAEGGFTPQIDVLSYRDAQGVLGPVGHAVKMN